MKAYHQVVRDLRQVYPEGEARALARWLCEERFGLSQTDLLLGKDNQLSADDIAVVQEITSRLLNHEPIQYILGETTFCGHRFSVRPGALIPRPETEELVRHVVDAVRARPSAGGAQASPLRILDIGTGTGCIAVSLALALPGSQVTAWDVSPQALSVAAENVARYPQSQVCLEQVDALSPPVDDRRWDVIVSNPPYVCQREAEAMERNVLHYEPHLALFVPDDDPLLFYRHITHYFEQTASPSGELWFEVNSAYGEKIAHFIEENTSLRAELLHDGFGNPRFVHATQGICRPKV